jgi:hypothetical protein
MSATPERALDQVSPGLVIFRKFAPPENFAELLRSVFAPWLDDARMTNLRFGDESHARGKANGRDSRNDHPRIDF